LSTATPTSLAPAMDVEKARFNMVEQQVRPWDVADSAVLGLLGNLPREAFVPAAYRSMAFADLDIPLTAPAQTDKCMLAPKVQARLLQDAAVQSTDNVLEIGTGSGYMAAMLGNQARQVCSIEIDATLASEARQNLAHVGVSNVDVVHADAAAAGFKACEPQAPYDVIVLGGSVAEVPAALLNLLKVGGRLVGIVGDEPMMRATLVTRATDTAFTTEQPWDYVAPRLANFPQPNRFTF
jgi:protein-L-isoaspartate(D-aspartate) O-methyltransferase